MKRVVKKSTNIALLTVALIFSGCNSKDSSKEVSESKQSQNKPAKIKVTQDAVKIEKKSQSKENSGQFYYSYNKKKNDEQKNELKVRTTLDAYLNIKSPYEKIKISLMISKLSHDFMVLCSACHNDYGNGIIGPSLLGKDGDFIYNRLKNFKNGKRDNVLMKELVSMIDDNKLKAISDEIAEFNKKLLKIRNREND